MPDIRVRGYIFCLLLKLLKTVQTSQALELCTLVQRYRTLPLTTLPENNAQFAYRTFIQETVVVYNILNCCLLRVEIKSAARAINLPLHRE